MKRLMPNSFSLWSWLIAGCLIIKSLLFYRLMDIEINLLFLWAATAFILILLFGSFKKQWIPFGLYVLLTVLMFCDVTYNAYFNGYLSVNAMGSAKYLGEVWGVIKSVIRPEFWLLFLDLPVIAVGLVKSKLSPERKAWPSTLLFVWTVTLLVLGSVSLSSFLQSAGNLEFFSAHIKDTLQATTAFGAPGELVPDEDFGQDETGEKTDYFGIAEGKNLIVIQMEAVQNFVIGKKYGGQEITPVLNRLIAGDGTLYFDHYYMQIAAGNTSDAEFATNNSLYGAEKSYTYELYKENTFRGLPVLLKEEGYSTIVMHGYEGSFWSRDDMYPVQGFDTFIDDEGYEPSVIHGWGILDEEFYKQSMDYLMELPQPFYSFMISLTNHTPFVMDEQYARLTLAAEHEGTRLGDYLNSTAYADYAIGVLLDALKEAGLYENSVIALYGDHFGLAQRDEDNEALLTEFLGKPYRFDEMANVPLIIHVPGEEFNETLHIAGGQIDFLPTIAYMMGLEDLETVYLGQNMLTANTGFVAQNRYAPRGSFITDGVVFFMSGDGVFENGRAWSTDTGEEVSAEGLKSLSVRSTALIAASEKYLETDAIGEWMRAGLAEKDTGEVDEDE